MIGQTISHYRILTKLGEGGMGVVYKAEDTKLRRTVALKFVSPQMVGESEAKARFVHEAQTVASLSHPNVCTVYEIDEVDGQVFLAMEYVEGPSLGDKIASGPLKLDEVLDIATQATEAIQAAHASGIVHRDIKPANIMLLATGQVKILDFGLARTREQTRLTKLGTTLGTIAYMSPEQAHGDEADHQSDIWALGVVLYEMVTGRLPFKGEHEQAILYSILNATPENVTGLRTGVPVELERIIGKALEPEKAHRYQHVDELLADLRRLREQLRTAEISRRITPAPGTVITPAPGTVITPAPGTVITPAPGTVTTPASGTVIQPPPRRTRVRTFLLPVGVIALLAVAFLFLRPLFFHQIAISDPTPIAVISFTNQTGDSSYDYLQEAIPNLLITSLEQSPYLRVATWERMRDVLAQMGRTDVEVIGRDLGFELCSHEGIHTIVLGSYVKAGDVFATDVKVLDVDSKILLKSAGSRGQGVGSILEKQIDELSHEIARAVGLSEHRIRATQPHIADVTTSSMEAYSYFLKGRAAIQQVYAAEAKRYLQKAVAIDSTFAVAHLYLALASSQLFDARAESQAFERAKAFAGRATERERLYIEALYAANIEKDREKQLRVCRELTEKYPEDKRGFLFLGQCLEAQKDYPGAVRAWHRALELDPIYGIALNVLAYAYADMDSIDEAIVCIERYTAVAPEDANALDSMGDMYFRLGRLDEAAAAYREALDIKSDFRSSALKLGAIAHLREDYDEMRRWIEAVATMTPGAGMAAEGAWSKAIFHLLRGRFADSLMHLEQGERLAANVDFVFGKFLAFWFRGWVYYAMGDLTRSRSANDQWSDLCAQHYPSSVTYQILYAFRRGLIELRQGQPDSTRHRLAEMQDVMPRVTDDQWRKLLEFRHGLLRCELLLHEDSLDAARAVAEGARPPEVIAQHRFIQLVTDPWFPQDVVARVHARAGSLDAAVAEYELLTVTDPNQRGRRSIHPIYHYRLAKLYEERGSRRAALREYEKFLEIWRDADEGIPELDDARERFVALR
ncbi:MAG: tetratricopeptide repeat protein [Candidatus Eisenbacteria sp.]|nr:tetratricopeptide repeat protein [Candidatus Eisenbacteria bacterium]